MFRSSASYYRFIFSLNGGAPIFKARLKKKRRRLVCAPRLPLGKIFADTSDDETLFAVAPGQGIPHPLLKSLNLGAALQTLHSESHTGFWTAKIIRPD